VTHPNRQLVVAALRIVSKTEYDYAVLSASDFLFMYKYDHFNRESFKKSVEEDYLPKKNEFLVRLSKKEGANSSGKQKNLYYSINNKWVNDKRVVRQSLLPNDIDAEQLELMELWVENYDKKALSKIKPLKDKSFIKEFLQKSKKHQSGHVLFYGDRDHDYGSAEAGTITFKHPTSLTPKKSVARGFGAPIGDYHGRPVGKGNIHSVVVKPTDVFHIPSVWAKYSPIIKQYAKEQEVIVQPGDYNTI